MAHAANIPSRPHALVARTVPAGSPQTHAGFAFWTGQVLEECDRVRLNFAPDPVHDLRVALRRCCSMAAGCAALDPDPAWKEMKRAGKRLFRRLGELRDLHVMQDWIRSLTGPDDPGAVPLLQFFSGREPQLQREALQAVEEFDRRQWERWARSLSRRMNRLRPGSMLFRHLALERWAEAHRLHLLALRHRSPAGFHRLRIGLKRFRYIVENFLPEQHAAWSRDLKHLQDLLGDVHDLDVLSSMPLPANTFPDSQASLRWQARIREERAQRIEGYRKKTLGRNSLWQVWRSGLPEREQVKSAALLRLRRWAAFLDPDFRHSIHVTRLALQLYDGLAKYQKPSGSARHDREILQAAALLHDVGRSRTEKGHHKASYRLIRRLAPPLGWRSQDLLLAGSVARYHRGALPRTGQKPLRGLSAKERQEISRLAAILRLASALDASRDGRIQKVEVQGQNELLLIAAQGYSSRDRLAEAVAAGRHLLETVYRVPVIIKPMQTVRIRPTARKLPAKALRAKS
jgi:CHAD domain-containing protein/HD superfamily phosphodiesterase